MDFTKLPTLYKIDSKGKTRVYDIQVFADHFTVYTGIEGSDNLVANTTYPKPKGKRTLIEQVHSEAQSKWDKKHKRELYHTDRTFQTPHPHSYIQPMLAHDYTKVPNRVDWSHQWVTQIKLNGVRCVAQGGKLTSRKGKEYIVPHITEALQATNYIFDGELYMHGMELGDITHAVAHGDPNLQYHIFDIVDTTMTYAQRRRELALMSDTLFRNPHIHRPGVFPVDSEYDLKKYHKAFISRGYEGAMLKDMDAYYENKRSLGLFKYKTFQDAEFKIISIHEDKDGGAILTLETNTGKTFQSRPTGSDSFRRQLVTDAAKVIGKYATVSYSELLASGIPEFNRVTSIRDYE